MNWHHIVFIAFLLIMTLSQSRDTGSINQNFDLKPIEYQFNIITEPRGTAIIKCDGRDFKSIGLPSFGASCETTKECFDYWPSGPSYQMRDRSVCCVEAGGSVGECGEFV